MSSGVFHDSQSNHLNDFEIFHTPTSNFKNKARGKEKFQPKEKILYMMKI